MRREEVGAGAAGVTGVESVKPEAREVFTVSTGGRVRAVLKAWAALG